MRKQMNLLILVFLYVGCSNDNLIVKDLTSQIDNLAERSNKENQSKRLKKELADSLLILVNLQDESFDQRANLFKVANRYYNLGEHKLEKVITQRIISESLKAKDSISLAKGYEYLGDYYDILQLSDSSVIYYRNAKEIYTRFGDRLKVAKLQLQMSQIKLNQNDMIGGETLALQSLDIFREYNDVKNIAQVYNSIGRVNYYFGDYKTSVKMLEKAIRILKEDGKVDNLSYQNYFTYNLGLLLFDMKSYEASYQIFCELLAKNLYNDHSSLYAAVLSNYARLRHILYPNKDDVPALFKKSIAIHDSISLSGYRIESRNQFVEYYLSVGDSVNAKEIAITAYELSKVDKYDKSLVLETLKNLIKTDPKNASKYSLQYISLNDSLQLAERQIRDKFQRIEFETDELQAERDDAVVAKGFYLNGFGIAFVIVAIAFFLVYRNLKSIKKQFAKFIRKSEKEFYEMLMAHQNKVMEGREIEKARISRELHDGVLNDLCYVRHSIAMAIEENSASGLKKCLEYLNKLQLIEKDIHKISRDLKAPLLNVDSYKSLIKDLITFQEGYSDVKWQFDQDPSIKWKKISVQTKVNIYRILQECMHNINKHSFATHASIKINKIKGKLVIEINDNGVGFDSRSISSGTGLGNIKTRVDGDGGTLDLQTDIGSGVKIILVYSI